MNFRLLLLLLVFCTSCTASQKPKYVFFLHNMYLELFPKETEHSEYGRVEYDEIVNEFKKAGFVVFSEIRPRSNDLSYASKVVKQIDSLIACGVDASTITVVGTSKGGYIAKQVSSLLKNPNLNYVLIGCCSSSDDKEYPDIYLYGRILSIYESSDSLACSCASQKKKKVPEYKEIELHTGIKHGFLYKALSEWLDPAIEWANGHYDNPMQGTILAMQIDSVLKSNPQLPFNGIVIISNPDATSLIRCQGYTDSTRKAPLEFDDEFIIGSISKQITSVLILREYDKGHLKLDIPIHTYLPELPRSWADTITIHQLLTHSHGIRDITGPLAFKPGTQFEYSPLIGYGLLSMIAERTSKKSFSELSQQLFSLCKMKRTFHPALGQHSRLVTGMTYDTNGIFHNTAAKNNNSEYVGSAGFITTVTDMISWNTMLHTGKLLSKDTYKKFIGKYQVRNHPSVGKADYGYGITSVDTAGIIQLGHTGASNGFLGMNYYFPQSGTSVIVLENLEAEPQNMRTSFFYIEKILKLVRENEIQIK